MSRKAVHKQLLDESGQRVQEAVTDQLVERISELGLTGAGLARRVGMESKTLYRALYHQGKQGMGLRTLERMCEELGLEVKLVPKRRT